MRTTLPRLPTTIIRRWRQWAGRDAGALRYRAAVAIVLTCVIFVGLRFLNTTRLEVARRARVDFRMGDVCAYRKVVEPPPPIPSNDVRIYVAVYAATNPQLGNALDQIALLGDRFTSDALFVSFAVNSSIGASADLIRVFGEVLRSRGIASHTLLVDPGEDHLRPQQLLQPLWDRVYPATHVVYLNSTMFCSEDVLRLVGQVGTTRGPGLASGVQFETCPSATTNSNRRVHVRMNSQTRAALGIGDAEGESSKLSRVLNGHPVHLQCCWSDMVCMRASLVSQPVSAPPGQCLGYNCHRMCQQARATVLDPGVIALPDQETRSLMAVAPLYRVAPANVLSEASG